MGRRVVAKRIDAQPDQVWVLLGDLTNIEWMPPTRAVECDGEGPGMRRRIYGSTDIPTVERLISIDEARHQFVYEIEENNPLPVSSYVVTVGVEADPAGGSLVSWAVDYETDDEATVAAGIDAVYALIAGWLSDATSVGEHP